jgi:hypothetical protein
MTGPATVTANSGALTGFAVTSSPAGTSVLVDSQSCPATPCQYEWVPGTTHTIAIPTAPGGGGVGVQYVYGSWSDGGCQSHTVTAPSSATIYTATFITQYLLTTSASPSAEGAISPASPITSALPIVASPTYQTIVPTMPAAFLVTVGNVAGSSVGENGTSFVSHSGTPSTEPVSNPEEATDVTTGSVHATQGPTPSGTPAGPPASSNTKSSFPAAAYHDPLRGNARLVDHLQVASTLPSAEVSEGSFVATKLGLEFDRWNVLM